MRQRANAEVRGCYVHVVVSGEFEPGPAGDLLQKWIARAREQGVSRILCDVTELTGFEGTDVPLVSVYEAALVVVKVLPPGFRIAFLEAPERIARARFGEDVMRNRGTMARITADLHEALTWLGVGDQGIGSTPRSAHCSPGLRCS